ncbi:MAG TPA: DUF2764 family protein [Mariniphaga sp.]|nr:DUF2764 family protein [Mariniphaga sp.]
MIKRKYYYLIAGLPDLIPDDKKLSFTSVQLRDYLKEDLHPDDFELVKLFYLPWDHNNLVRFMFKEKFEWDERGNYSPETIELLADKKQFELIDLTAYPDYLIEFLEIYHDDEEDVSKTKSVKMLTEGWYRHLQESDNKFVREFADYKQTMGNILLALNRRKHDIEVEDAFIGDNEITSALKKSRARDFGLANEVNEIETIIQIYETGNMLDRELRFDSHFWQFLDESTFFDYFTIERILAFVQKLFIAERWFLLDKEKGQQIFNQLLDELQSKFEFPEEFAITYGKRK